MPTIVYLDTLPAQNGLDILHSQSKVEILKINSSDNEEKCMSILQKADAYQVGAARDEVPKYSILFGLMIDLSLMLVKKTLTFTTSFEELPAATRQVFRSLMAISNWSFVLSGIVPSKFIPTNPETQTTPFASTTWQ